ncbi:MAG: hypothetical protein ACRDGM_04145 [bacterium]
MTTRDEDLDRDRTRALRMIAPQRAIETRNIETYWGRWGKFSDDPGAAPASLLGEVEELWDGKVVLVLPDGSRWVHVNALLRHDLGGDNRYVQRLRQLLLAHMAVSEHIATGRGLSDFSLNAASLDLRHVFCHECTRCVDLSPPRAG